MRPDGTLELALKSIWRDGTRAIVFSPEDLRKEIVPRSPPDAAAIRPAPAIGDQIQLAFDAAESDEPPHRNRWAWLLAHVFRADLETCPRCGGPMRWADAATTRKSAARLLAELGLGPQPPPDPPASPLGQLRLPFAK